MEYEDRSDLASASSSDSSQQVLSDDMHLARKPGFLMRWTEEESLVLWSKRQRSNAELNFSAALVWLLCDGKLNVKGIKERLAALYPAQAEGLDEDVPGVLADLLARQLLEFSASKEPARPVIRVGFYNFWPGFDHRDNYFLQMLTHKFDVMLVDPPDGDLDLVFYSIFLSQYDHNSIDRSQSVKIFVCLEENRIPDFTECDYAITTNSDSEQFSDRHSYLPLWCFYLDWERYEESEAAFRGNILPDTYKPDKVCDHLFQAIFHASSLSEEDTMGEQVPPQMAQSLAPPSITKPTVQPVVIPAERKKLAIGMATYDDFDGVYFTVQAIRLYHPEVTDDTEILVVDNNPEGPCSEALRNLGNWVQGYRYIPYRERQSTAVRDVVFHEAHSDYVMCIDSHVLVAPGALKKLIHYLDNHPECQDLLQGPMVYDNMNDISTHFKPEWSQGMYGVWGTDQRGKDPEHEAFEIPMQGLGLFACRKETWQRFNPRFLGFGGEEGYIHEKFRQAGHRALCLPFLRWLHRFGRPLGSRYQNIWEHRIRNYFIGFTELGLDVTPIADHFRELLGAEAFERIHQTIMTELDNPFFYFDAIYCINLDSAGNRWQKMQQRFKKLGILNRVRRFSAIETPESHHIGCTLSHRQIIEQAQKHQFKNVLVFEDDAIFLEETLTYLKYNIDELKTQPWNLLHMGGYKWGQRFPTAPGCQFLQSPCRELTSAHAVVYNYPIYQKILDDLPADVAAMEEWITAHYAIDQYLRGIERRYITFPVVASQPVLLAQEDPEYRDKFTL